MSGPLASAGAKESPPDHPDLPIKPPLVSVAALVIGYGVDHLAPMPARPEGFGWTGIALVVFALLLLLWATRQFNVARTSVKPWKPTRTILENGPFAFSRNPIYLAFLLMQVGLGLWHDRLAVLLMVVPAMLVLDRVVIRREEAYLERKFGATYLGYKGRVRRWI